MNSFFLRILTGKIYIFHVENCDPAVPIAPRLAVAFAPRCCALATMINRQAAKLCGGFTYQGLCFSNYARRYFFDKCSFVSAVERVGSSEWTTYMSPVYESAWWFQSHAKQKFSFCKFAEKAGFLLANFLKEFSRNFDKWKESFKPSQKHVKLRVS